MARSYTHKIKPQVRGLTPYTLKQYDYDVKLNQNENPFDFPQEIKEEVLQFARERCWSRYPDFTQKDMVQALSRYTGWPEDGILVGNGSNELVQATLITFIDAPDTTVLIPTPTFTLYRLLCKALGANVLEVYLTENYRFDIEAIKDATETNFPDVMIFCSPNNPTGCVLENSDIEDLLNLSDGLIVVDEAYYEFRGETCFCLLKDYPNLIIFRTFSKALSLAGLRIGYLMAHPELVEQISKVKLPYNLNFFSQIAAMKALENRDLLQKNIDYLIGQRDILYNALKDIEGVVPYPSYANFILFETQSNSKDIFEGLLQQGVLIRDVSGYPMLSRALRFNVGIQEENTRFLDALKETVRSALRKGSLSV